MVGAANPSGWLPRPQARVDPTGDSGERHRKGTIKGNHVLIDCEPRPGSQIEASFAKADGAFFFLDAHRQVPAHRKV